MSPAADIPFGVLFATACVGAAVVGFLKASAGGGIGLVLTPILSQVLPAQVVLGLTAPMLNLSDPITIRYYWKRWDGRHFRMLLPPTLLGVALGTYGMSLLSDVWLKRAIASVALVFALLQLALMGRQRQLFGSSPHWTAGAAAGIGSGIASAVAHSGGVVMGPYLLGFQLSNVAVVGTINAVFAIANCLTIGAYWKVGFLTGKILLAAVLSTPLIVAGVWLGYRLTCWLPRRWFEIAMLALAVAGSLRLLLTS